MPNKRFEDDIDFSVNLLCTMQFRNGAEQYMDSIEELTEWLEEIRKEIEAKLTNWNDGVMHSYGTSIPAYLQTPIILADIQIELDTGVKNDSPMCN